VATGVVGHERLAAQDLHPGGLAGAELAQAQLAVAVEAQEQPRGLVAQGRLLG
jgi:hypothetical protein